MANYARISIARSIVRWVHGVVIYCEFFVDLNHEKSPMRKKWNAMQFSIIGFLFGAGFSELAMIFRPHSIPSVHAPILTAVLGGVMGLIVFGGAAISHNRFESSMSKFD